MLLIPKSFIALSKRSFFRARCFCFMNASSQISSPICFPLPQLSASPSLPFCLFCCCLSHQTFLVGGELWLPASAGSVSRPAEHLLSGSCPPTSAALLPALPLPGRSILRAGQEPLSAHTLLFWAPWPTWATFLHRNTICPESETAWKNKRSQSSCGPPRPRMS